MQKLHTLMPGLATLICHSFVLAFVWTFSPLVIALLLTCNVSVRFCRHACCLQPPLLGHATSQTKPAFSIATALQQVLCMVQQVCMMLIPLSRYGVCCVGHSACDEGDGGEQRARQAGGPGDKAHPSGCSAMENGVSKVSLGTHVNTLPVTSFCNMEDMLSTESFPAHEEQNTCRVSHVPPEQVVLSSPERLIWSQSAWH